MAVRLAFTTGIVTQEGVRLRVHLASTEATLSAQDPESGVLELSYSVDGCACIDHDAAFWFEESLASVLCMMQRP